MVGQSEPMRRLFGLIRKVAANDTPALILGETGTGKELVANALHQLSKHSPYMFWAMNCAAISPQLVESELFGHERGAFTGATDLRRGAFEQAGRGTLFLDEVGELSLDVQSKLLRVLETQKIRRVGGGEEIPVKCRIVAATHRHLIEEVQKKRFREDLYYRLFVMPIEVPPLRNRNGDILSISERFLQEMSPERPPLLTEEARQKLLSHRWPGNVRELKNVILRSVMLSEGETINPHHLVFLPHSMESGESPQEVPARTMEEMEREMILQKLKETEWNKAKAARKLGIATSTIFKKIKEYGLKE
ncbi:MAG: sigma-54-dependent Fis family transcriptional regulator [Deltaproteobacteria bacterium]|nr:sigma-54-dependent Fis family transcriptional regulator [Deltaproteobacteria bacterium]